MLRRVRIEERKTKNRHVTRRTAYYGRNSIGDPLTGPMPLLSHRCLSLLYPHTPPVLANPHPGKRVGRGRAPPLSTHARHPIGAKLSTRDFFFPSLWCRAWEVICQVKIWRAKMLASGTLWRLSAFLKTTKSEALDSLVGTFRVATTLSLPLSPL